jgi:hypothetical protein
MPNLYIDFEITWGRSKFDKIFGAEQTRPAK